MKIINPEITDIFVSNFSNLSGTKKVFPTRMIEMAARNCWQSFDKTNLDIENIPLLDHIYKNGHMTPFEFASFVIHVITDRGVLAELTRHRMNAYCVESTRYVNNSKEVFGQGTGCVYIRPVFTDPKCTGVYITPNDDDAIPSFIKSIKSMSGISEKTEAWLIACGLSEYSYLTMTDNAYGLAMQPQEARTALNQSTKTSIMFTANWRQMLHMAGLRADTPAHPEIRRIFIPVMEAIIKKYNQPFGHISDFIEKNKEQFLSKGWDLAKISCDAGNGEPLNSIA